MEHQMFASLIFAFAVIIGSSSGSLCGRGRLHMPTVGTDTSGGTCPAAREDIVSELSQNVSVLLQEIVRCTLLGTTPEYPATSCAEIAQYKPDSLPGNYWILNSTGFPVETFCTETVYHDCMEAYENGSTASGVYTIQPDDGPPFAVYCDMDTDGGGWTVFQRRKDGSEDFYRDWVDYEEGFGNLTGEFWLGLEKLHIITDLSSGPEGNELRVDMEDFDGNDAYAKYEGFFAEDATTKYTLTVGGYSGTAGDSLTRHNGQMFSTRDQDNDAFGEQHSSCAQRYKGGWWYETCHSSNLNGLYLGGAHTSYADGVNWQTWRGYYYSLKFTEMKVHRQ